MFWLLKRFRDNIFSHFCGCFLFWRENVMQRRLPCWLLLLSFPLFLHFLLLKFFQFKILNRLLYKNAWCCTNILLIISLESLKGNTLLSLSYTQSQKKIQLGDGGLWVTLRGPSAGYARTCYHLSHCWPQQGEVTGGNDPHLPAAAGQQGGVLGRGMFIWASCGDRLLFEFSFYSNLRYKSFP